MRNLFAPSAALAGMVAATLTAGCSQQAARGSDSHVITFAGLNTLTGPSALPGLRTQQGAQVAVSLINDAGGFKDKCGNKYTVEISTHDIGTTGDAAIAALRGAAGDTKVLSVIGPTASTGFLPMVSVANGLKVPVIGMGTAPIPNWNSYVYRISTPRPVADTAMLTKLVQTLQVKKVALIYDQGQQSEAAGEKLVQDLAGKLGYQVVAAEAFRTGDQNVTTQIQKVQSSGADLIGLMTTPGDMGRIALQMSRSGIKTPFFTSAGNSLDPAIWKTSEGAINGSYTWTTFDFNSLTPEGKKFVDAFQAKFNATPTLQSIWGSDAIAVALDAVKRSCSATDRKAFVKQLGATSGFTGGLGGEVTYQNPPTGENQTPHVDVVKVTGSAQYEPVK